MQYTFVPAAGAGASGRTGAIGMGDGCRFYRLIPKIVLFPNTEEEVSGILKQAGKRGIPVTFRASGTSLSGQAVSDSVLIVAGQVDKCIECGFCEVKCLTCGFTLSSRQRIVVRREISRLTQTGENPAYRRKLLKQYRYPGEETCAKQD